MIVGALVRCHCRPMLLEIVLQELLRYQDLSDLVVKIHVLSDRPTVGVSKVLMKYSRRLFNLMESPFPLLSPGSGERRFMDALRLQHADLLKDGSVDWFYLADDDRWLEPHHALPVLKDALWNPGVDLWYANSLFMWDEPDKYQPHRAHFSPVFSRRIPGDEFPTNRIIQAPALVHDQSIMCGRTGVLPIPLLDYGSFHAVDRLRLHAAFVEAGKIDPYVDSLLAPSTGLHTFPADAVAAGLMPDLTWRDLWTEKLQCPSE